jgi:hypothetical protein
MVDRPADILDHHRLGEEIVAAEAHRAHGVVEGPVSGHQQEGHAELLGEIEAVAVGQLEVADQRFGRALGDQRARLAQAARGLDAMAVLPEAAGQRRADAAFVLNHQQPHARC